MSFSDTKGLERNEESEEEDESEEAEEPINLDAIRQEVQKIKSCLQNWNDTENED